MFDFKLTLVSSDRDAVRGVESYLTRSGARVSTTSRLDDALGEPADADAVVLFADDYPPSDVLRTVRQLATRLVVIVSGHEQDFAALWSDAPPTARVVVLPRPTWGWMLLDAVRSGVKRGEEGT
jgi:hypothetical protein